MKIGLEEQANEAVAATDATPAADANRQLSADEIAALFAATSDASPSSSETKPIPEPEVIAEPEQEPASAAPVSADANRQLSPEEIAALFSSVR